jgi:hypothetical protein
MPYLHEVALNEFPKLSSKIDEPIVQKRLLQLGGALKLEQGVQVKHIPQIILI